MPDHDDGCDEDDVGSSVAEAEWRAEPLTDVLEATIDSEALLPDELFSLREARLILNRVLDGLGDASRQVFVLYELEGLSLREVCERLSIPTGTIDSRLRRARQTVARELEKLGYLGREPWRHTGRRWRTL